MSVGWHFDELKDKAEQNADLLTKHAFENDIDTFVRETLQNANDARRDGYDGSIEVYYRFTRLAGDELDEFLKELDWDTGDSDDVSLKSHLEWAGKNEDDRQLNKFLRQIQDSGELLLLTVEDRFTQGLPGSETEDGTNYTSLIRDMGRSNKGDTEGGSHGVGKTVLWAFSGLSTVLFTSTPAEPETGETAPRFVGRTLLPDHRDEDEQLYSGNGWYGQVDHEDPEGRYVSIWDEDGLASERSATLYTEQGTLDSDTDIPDGMLCEGRVSGTAATVLGFRDPTEEVNSDEVAYEDIADQFHKTVARYFWPAIEHDLLKVRIRGPDDDEYSLVTPSEIPEVAPFVHCFRDRSDHVEELEERGAVVKQDVELNLPDKDDEEGKGKTEDVGYVSVYARRPGPGDDDTRLNEVAIFRGAGMVVDYVSMEKAAAYGSTFFGLMVAGEARGWGTEDGPSTADTQIDELLRTSEPAAHDEWKGYKNTKLGNKYEEGAPTLVYNLTRKTLQGALQDLVKLDDVEDDDEISAMNQKSPKLNVGGGGSSKTHTPSVESSDAFEVNLEFNYRGGEWVFEGSLGPTETDFESWEASFEIRTIGEDDTETGRIDIDELLPLEPGVTSRYEDGVAYLEATSGASSVSIRGESINLGSFDPYSGRLGRTKLLVEGNVDLGGGS
ncbi:hypothetical protein [Halogranum rubrum]|uniref:Uncharacterized protein n=1 Tax=Halogranum salarium B-1 TaxID=1210908 RepID=J3EU29_9EURY|nr:hypothetical protein [Halogranum salarium]EJN57782.1 hypothetical protein HSB1_38670 [Halogranum salarium B-1]